MSNQKYVMGIFPNEDQTISALGDLVKSKWQVEGVHSPIPSPRILDTLGQKKSKVGYFTLAGGILGFFIGLGLAIFTATRWDLIVSGKPVVALIPFFIVGFEFTILFSVFGNVVGFLIQSRLPEFEGLNRYDPRCSEDCFGILAACDESDEESLIKFFLHRGAEPRVFDRNSPTAEGTP